MAKKDEKPYITDKELKELEKANKGSPSRLAGAAATKAVNRDEEKDKKKKK